jgi:septum formation protein
MTNNSPSVRKTTDPRTLILASQSPRRRQLLTESGFKFLTKVVDTPEILDQGLALDDAILKIARGKAMAVHRLLESVQNPLVLSSDTLVILNASILGKPTDAEEARSFLRRLSGSTHQVKTAVHFWDVTTDFHIGAIETSRVTFRTLQEIEIEDYVQSGEPLDKAGAYGIQGQGANFISKLEGNLDNVMGLSIGLVKEIIKGQNWKIT